MTVRISKMHSVQKLLATMFVGGIVVAFTAAVPNRIARDIALRLDGLTITYSINSSTMTRQIKQMSNRIITSRMLGGSMRMDFTSGTPLPGQAGTYTLMLGDSKQTVMVNDMEKSVLMMDAQQSGSAGSALNNPVVEPTMSNESFNYQDLGDGGKILGFATRRVRTMTGSTMEMNFAGTKHKTVTMDTTEVWITHDLVLDEKDFIAWGRSFAERVDLSNPELAAKREKFRQDFARNGFTLKSVKRTSVADEKGGVHTDTTTMIVTSVKKGPIDPSIFAIPKDYKVTNVADRLSEMRARIDSLKAGTPKKKGGF